MRKKIMIIVPVFLIALMFTIGSASADTWYYSRNLVKVTASTDGVVLTIADDAGNVLLQKYIAASVENKLLAIALTAQSMGQKVHVYHQTSSDTITRLVLSTES